MALGLESILVQDLDLIATLLDDEVVLLSVRAGAYFGFNDVGSEIWKLIETPRRISDICNELSRTYQRNAESMFADVVSFLDQLLQHGLVRLADGGAPR